MKKQHPWKNSRNHNWKQETLKEYTPNNQDLTLRNTIKAEKNEIWKKKVKAKGKG